jgi:hypothetical protein
MRKILGPKSPPRAIGQASEKKRYSAVSIVTKGECGGQVADWQQEARPGNAGPATGRLLHAAPMPVPISETFGST